MIPLAFWEGLGVGLLASVVGTAALWWYLHQRERGGGQRLAGAHAPAPRASPPLATTTLSVPVAASVAAVGPGAPESPPRPIAAPTFQTGSSVAVATDGSDVPAPANGGQVRISQRVLYHIARQGRIGAEEVAPR
ncbi:MAG: hypothetical protein L3J91_05785, partial [Thermoplasmata archaeon]|nr:hypothetical protein [Thermoplasmata archaeon]